MKFLYWCILAFILSACSSVKQSQQALNGGDYDESIRIAVEHLRKDKTKKRNQAYIGILENAFSKAVARDETRINFLKADGNSAGIGEVFALYNTLNERQETIRPLLPLRGAKFSFKDYSQEIIAAKESFVKYLYKESLPLFDRDTKESYRAAYQNYAEIENLSPNYKDVRVRMEEAHRKGVDFVLVKLYNETEQVIPKRLETDLLDFQTYGLDTFWTVYDSEEHENTYYDFGINLIFKNIVISPESVNEKELVREKQIKDGKEFVRDEDGKILKDSIGNKLEQDRYITIKGRMDEVLEQKDCHIEAIVDYIDFTDHSVMRSFPLASGFAFRHRYGKITGDKRVFDEKLRRISRMKYVPFPSNEQMIFDAGMDLKNKLKACIINNGLR